MPIKYSKRFSTSVQMCDHSWNMKKAAAGNALLHVGASAPFADKWRYILRNDIGMPLENYVGDRFHLVLP